MDLDNLAPNPENIITEDTAAMTRAYGFMMMGLLLSVVPLWYVSGLGFTLMLVGIIYTYATKRGLSDKPISFEHRRWIIRTFWIGSLVLLAGMCAAWGIVSANMDPVLSQQLADAINSGTATPEEIRALLEELQAKSKTLFTISDIITAAPAVLYMGARLVRGYARLDKGEMPKSVKTWLV